MVVDIPTNSKTKATDDLAWRVDSVCREHPTHLWFAASSRDMATAKALCGDCAVQSSCLEFALSRPELLGIWAATTPSERASLRRAARTGAAFPPDVLPGDPPEPAVVTGPALDVVSAAEADGQVPGEAGPPAPADVDLALDLELDDLDDLEAELDGTASDELLTPAEAARRLGVTPNTVTRWSRAGKISAIQTIGGHRRYRSSEIEKVLRRFGPLS